MLGMTVRRLCDLGSQSESFSSDLLPYQDYTRDLLFHAYRILCFMLMTSSLLFLSRVLLSCRNLPLPQKPRHCYTHFFFFLRKSRNLFFVKFPPFWQLPGKTNPWAKENTCLAHGVLVCDLLWSLTQYSSNSSLHGICLTLPGTNGQKQKRKVPNIAPDCWIPKTTESGSECCVRHHRHFKEASHMILWPLMFDTID